MGGKVPKKQYEPLTLARHRGYSTFILGTLAFLVSFFAASVFMPVHNSGAQEITIENSINGNYVSVTSSDTLSLEVEATPAGTLAAVKDTINVKTNVSSGYKLLLQTSTQDIYSTKDTSKVSAHFSAGSADSILAKDTWGYTLTAISTPTPSASATFSPVPATASEIKSYSEATSSSGDDTDIYYGFNASTNLPTGTYLATVTYTAFAEDAEEYDKMQDFTITKCQALTENQIISLTDSRDGKGYNVIKAKDGHCWMIDNLRYDIVSSSSWSTNNYTDKLLHITTGSGYEGEYYYNYAAALEACPTGWSLPVSGSKTVDHSWAKLMNAYGITTGADLLNQTELGFEKYYGYWSYGRSSESHQGEDGDFWSSTPTSAENARYFFYKSASITTQHNGSKNNGRTVRCVFEDRTLEDLTYLQDINPQVCANTETSTAATILDKRGHGSAGSDTTTGYGVIKATDGNCWMTDNLQLYNITLDSATSDISDSFTLPASSDWTTNIYDSAKLHVSTNSGYEGEVYYNWCSAVALTDCSTTTEQNQSICPKNWQLPVNGDTSTNKSFAKLLAAYSITTSDELLANSSLGFKYYGDYRWSQGSEWHQDSNGYFWSSTPTDAENAYLLLYGASSTINSQFESTKGTGRTIRCLAR